jgi:hypothetical protein
MGYVMELLYAREGARDRVAFARGLRVLKGKTAWTRGAWKFGEDDVVPWNGVENVQRQIMALAQHLVTLIKRSPISQAA